MNLNLMSKLHAINNFISFVVPLSCLIICKSIMPESMYNSIVNYNADKMSKKTTRGLEKMYTESICPKIFLNWSTKNLNGIKSAYNSLLLELNCKAFENTPIEEIECIEFNSLKSVPLSNYINANIPTVINIGSVS